MNPGLTLATTARVLRQVRTDHRTIGLIMIVPMVLIGLLAWIYGNTPVFDQIGPALLGVFPMQEIEVPHPGLAQGGVPRLLGVPKPTLQAKLVQLA